MQTSRCCGSARGVLAGVRNPLGTALWLLISPSRVIRDSRPCRADSQGGRGGSVGRRGVYTACACQLGKASNHLVPVRLCLLHRLLLRPLFLLPSTVLVLGPGATVPRWLHGVVITISPAAAALASCIGPGALFMSLSLLLLVLLLLRLQ